MHRSLKINRQGEDKGSQTKRDHFNANTGMPGRRGGGGGGEWNCTSAELN